MSALRLSLAGTVILTVLGMVGGAVVAQEPTDKATHVTGTVTASRTVTQLTYTPYDEYMHNTGYGGVYEYDVDWSDPRLPSLMRVAENWDFFGLAENTSPDVNGAISVMGNVRLEGPDGAWTGMKYGLLEETKPVERYPGPEMIILSGEGAYEGLSAMLSRTYDEPPAAGAFETYEGYILHGELPPMPEAPEPSAG
jgi:hypothetical protein